MACVQTNKSSLKNISYSELIGLFEDLYFINKRCSDYMASYKLTKIRVYIRG